MREVKMSPGMKEMHETMNRVLGIDDKKPSFMNGLFPIADKGKEPCGECHLQPDETCDICHARKAGLSE